MQAGELVSYVNARGWIVASLHEEEMSGAKNDRYELQKVLAMAQSRDIDAVLVWKLDRFGRSATDLLNNIRTLDRSGVRFISTSQGIDTIQSDPVSRFLLTTLGAVAELEREMICERVRAGQQRAKAKGVKFGRHQKVYNRIHALELREDGATIRQIAKALEVGVGTIHRLLNGVPKVPLQTQVDIRWKGGRFAGSFEGPKG